MAQGSLTRKIINGHSYYYLRYSERVNGKPKVTRQVYLGKSEDIVAAVQGQRTGLAPKRVTVAEFGAVAAIWSFVERTNLIDIIDTHVPKREQGLSVGEYMAIAVVNRAVCPKSKSKIGRWFSKTCLPRLTAIEQQQLTPQRFWDHMDMIEAEDIEAIETEFTTNVVERFDIDLDCLALDATNFFTFINTRNFRSELAQRGHNKNGRDDLRQVSLMLLVSADFHIPLFHKTYEGNCHDAVIFRQVLRELRERQEEFIKHCEEITVVFDKGNNSEEGFELLDLDDTKFKFIGSLCPCHHPDLLAIALDEFEELSAPRLEAVSVFRTTKKVFGVERTITVTFNENLYNAQYATLEQQIAKCKAKLNAIRQQLNRHRRGKVKEKRPTLQGTKNRVNKICKARHIRDIFKVDVFEQKGFISLRYRVQTSVIDHLCSTLFGKTILFTNQDDWSDEDIVYGYRGQYRVEDAFRTMKDPHFVTFRPCFHWTDQKIRVHAWYCVLALTMASLMQRELSRHGIEISIAEAIDSLNDIKEVAMFYNRSTKNPAVNVKLSDMNELQQTIYDALELKKYAPA